MSFIWKFLKRHLFVGKKVKIGSNFHLGMMSYVSAPWNLEIGNDVYIGKFCSIQCNGTIGDGVLIANNVGIVGRADHDIASIGTSIRMAPWAGTSDRLAQDPRNWIVIDQDVWVGFGSVLLSGITVGRGAVIAAGSVVVRDVNPYAVVAGNPARQVGERFSAEERAEHERALSSQRS